MGSFLPSLSAGRCEMPKDPGPCVSFMSRWYFNSESGRCEKFIYGGCQGNRNKFLTELECTAECGSEKIEVVPTNPPPTPSHFVKPEHTADGEIFFHMKFHFPARFFSSSILVSFPSLHLIHCHFIG